jgi:hypothetical protein
VTNILPLDPEPAPPPDATDLQPWCLWDETRTARFFEASCCEYAGFEVYLAGVQFFDGSTDRWVYATYRNKEGVECTTEAQALDLADQLHRFADDVETLASRLL